MRRPELLKRYFLQLVLTHCCKHCLELDCLQLLEGLTPLFQPQSLLSSLADSVVNQILQRSCCQHKSNYVLNYAWLICLLYCLHCHMCNHVVYPFSMYSIMLKIKEYEFDSRITLKHYILFLEFFDNHFPCFLCNQKFKRIMRSIQGALIVASTLQIVLGFSGLWRNVARLAKVLTYSVHHVFSVMSSQCLD